MSCNLTRIITASLIFSQVISAIPRCDLANPCIQATDSSVLSDRYCFTTQAMSVPLLGNFHGVPVLRDTRMQTAQLDRFFENGHIRHRHSEIPDQNGPVSLPTPEGNTGGRRRVVGFTEGDGTSDFEGNSSVLHEGSVSPREAEQLTRAWFSAGYTRLCLTSVPLGKRGLLDNILGQRGVAQLGSRFENGEADVYLEWSAAFAKYVITKVQARTEDNLLNPSNHETCFFKTVYGRDSSGKYSILLDSFYDRSPHHRGSVWASHGYREIQLRPFVLDSHGRFGSLGIPHVANLGSNYADGEARCDFVWSEAMQSYFPTLVHARTKKASTSDEPFKSFPLKLVWSIEEHRNVLIGSIWEDSPRHAGMIWAAKGFRHIRIDSIPVYNDGDFHILGRPYWRYFRRSRGMRTGSAYFSLDGESNSYLFQDAFLSSAKRVSAFDPIKGNWRLVPERHAGAALRWAREHGFEQIKIEALPIRGEEGQIDIPGQGDHVFVGAGYRRGNADLYLSWSESSRKFITTHVSARQEESVSATYLPLRLVYGKSNNGYTDLLDSFLHRSPTHHGRPWMALGYRDIKITSVPLRAHGTFRVINANQERLGDIYAGGLAEVFLALTDSRHPAYRITHVLAQTRNQVLSGETGTVLPFNTVWGCSASGGYDHFIGVFR